MSMFPPDTTHTIFPRADPAGKRAGHGTAARTFRDDVIALGHQCECRPDFSKRCDQRAIDERTRALEHLREHGPAPDAVDE